MHGSFIRVTGSGKSLLQNLIRADWCIIHYEMKVFDLHTGFVN